MVPIGPSQVFDSLANLAYLVRDRIDPLCLDQETAEALADAEDLIRQVIDEATKADYYHLLATRLDNTESTNRDCEQV